MLSSLRQQIFYSIFGLLLIAGFPWLLFLLNTPEDIKKLGEIGYFEGGQYQHFPVNQFPESFFNLIRLGYPVAVLVFLALSLAFFKTELSQIPGQLIKLFSKFRNFIRLGISNLSTLEKLIAGITFLLIITERYYYLFRYPIHTDEVASYLMFIRNGPFAISTFYPIPNNHIFENLLAWPLTFIFNDPIWVIRLPVLFFSFLLTSFGFLILKRFSGFLTAYLATALFSFGSLTLFFSTQGRGYMLLTFLAVISMGLTYRVLQTQKAGYWVIFSLVAIFGFFTVPVFTYPFAVCLAFAGLYFLSWKNWKAIVQLGIAAVITLIGTLILYTPLLLVSGKAALFDNKYLAPLTPEIFSRAFLTFLIEVQGELFGGKFGYGIRLFLMNLVILALLFLLQKHPLLKRYFSRQTNWLAGFALLATVIIYCFMRVQLYLPPPRVLFFKSFFDYLGLAVVLSVFLQVIFRKTKLLPVLGFAGILVFAGFQVVAAEKFLKDYPQPYYTSPALIKLILKNNAQRVFLEEPFYQHFLEFEYVRAGKAIKIENQVPKPAPLYDFVVIEHGRPFPEAISAPLYEQVYQDDLVKAYRPKAALKIKENPKKYFGSIKFWLFLRELMFQANARNFPA